MIPVAVNHIMSSASAESEDTHSQGIFTNVHVQPPHISHGDDLASLRGHAAQASMDYRLPSSQNFRDAVDALI